MSIIHMINENNVSRCLPMTDEEVWTSLFVPNIPKDIIDIQNEDDKDHFKYLIEGTFSIGSVKRIDYVVKDGRGSAFIHFNFWFDSNSNKIIRNEIDTNGACKLAGIESNGNIKFMLKAKSGKPGYLTFKHNKNVLIARKDELESLNVLQLAKLVRELTAENTELKNEILAIKEGNLAIKEVILAIKEGIEKVLP